MDTDKLIPALAIIFIFGAPVAAWIVSRVLAHQERIEMIRRGMTPPPVPPDPRMMRKAMRYGAWQPGAPMPPGPYPNYYDPSYYAQNQLRRGIQVAFIGFALLVGLSFIGYRGDGNMNPGPWLLGGLIPMFVGIAQIIGAVLSGARIGSFGTGPAVGSATFGPPEGAGAPPSAPAGNMPPPPPSSYGGWRPGSTPEIEKPAQPPDRF